MSYFIFATLLLAAASGIFSLYQHAKKLQQNAYSLLGYFKWLKDSYTDAEVAKMSAEEFDALYTKYGDKFTSRIK